MLVLPNSFPGQFPLLGDNALLFLVVTIRCLFSIRRRFCLIVRRFVFLLPVVRHLVVIVRLLFSLII